MDKKYIPIRYEQGKQVERVVIRNHEGAAAGSFSLEIRAETEEIKTILARQLELLADWVRGNQGIIGHIKASLELPRCVECFSITDSKLERKTESSHLTAISVAAIVFFVDGVRLQEQLETCLQVLKRLDMETRSKEEV